MTEWRDIPGYEHYEASDAGQIRSKLPSKMTPANHILKPRIVGAGYYGVSLYRDGKKTDLYVHRLVMLAFHGHSELQVNHKDFDKSNNALDNLEYCTGRANTNHAWNGGVLQPPPVLIGEAHGRAKITNAQAMEVKRLLEWDKIGSTEISRITGISRHIVEQIKANKTWTHITLPQE
jgi:hypothetical protein